MERTASARRRPSWIILNSLVDVGTGYEITELYYSQYLTVYPKRLMNVGLQGEVALPRGLMPSRGFGLTPPGQ